MKKNSNESRIRSLHLDSRCKYNVEEKNPVNYIELTFAKKYITFFFRTKYYDTIHTQLTVLPTKYLLRNLQNSRTFFFGQNFPVGTKRPPSN